MLQRWYVHAQLLHLHLPHYVHSLQILIFYESLIKAIPFSSLNHVIRDKSSEIMYLPVKPYNFSYFIFSFAFLLHFSFFLLFFIFYIYFPQNFHNLSQTSSSYYYFMNNLFTHFEFTLVRLPQPGLYSHSISVPTYLTVFRSPHLTHLADFVGKFIRRNNGKRKNIFIFICVLEKCKRKTRIS